MLNLFIFQTLAITLDEIREKSYTDLGLTLQTTKLALSASYSIWIDFDTIDRAIWSQEPKADANLIFCIFIRTSGVHLDCNTVKVTDCCSFNCTDGHRTYEEKGIFLWLQHRANSGTLLIERLTLRSCGPTQKGQASIFATGGQGSMMLYYYHCNLTNCNVEKRGVLGWFERAQYFYSSNLFFVNCSQVGDQSALYGDDHFEKYIELSQINFINVNAGDANIIKFYYNQGWVPSMKAIYLFFYRCFWTTSLFWDHVIALGPLRQQFSVSNCYARECTGTDYGSVNGNINVDNANDHYAQYPSTPMFDCANVDRVWSLGFTIESTEMFSSTNPFTYSSEFLSSSLFSHTISFSESFSLFSSSEMFKSPLLTESMLFSKSLIVSESLNFTETSFFSGSSVFSRSISFSESKILLRTTNFTSQAIVSSQTDSEKYSQTLSESEIHSEQNIISISTTQENEFANSESSKSSTLLYLIIGIAIFVVLVLIAVIIVFRVMKNKKKSKSIIFTDFLSQKPNELESISQSPYQFQDDFTFENLE